MEDWITVIDDSSSWSEDNQCEFSQLSSLSKETDELVAVDLQLISEGVHLPHDHHVFL